MNEQVRKYLTDKYGLDFEKKAQQDYDDQSDRLNTGNLFANLGDVIAGNKVGSSNAYFDARRKEAKENTVGKIEKDQEQYVKDYDLDRKFKQDSETDAVKASERDANSTESKLAQSLAVKMGMNPEQAKNLTAEKFKTYSPSLQKMYEIEQNRLNRIEARNEKLKSQEAKQKELSVAQAKQAGVFRSGALAESQYANATSSPDEYNPTNVGQIFDNDTTGWVPNLLRNKKAIEAESARDAWIESFLRDASGAAIAPSERAAYARIYFPQPKDSPEIVKNKALLRKQKMESAREAAGIKVTPDEAGQTIKTLTKGTVLMRGPDGFVREIPADQVEAAKAAGGVEI